MSAKTLLHSAKLIHRTENAEQLIAYCARVSNPPNQNNENIEGLLRYCAKHGHWSVFEMASMCIEIYTTRAISPQILRHGKGFSFQEFSQRYSSVNLLPELDELPELRRQDTKNRQNSIDDLDPSLTREFEWQMQRHIHNGNQLYQRMLDSGIAKECARNVLPLHTQTRLLMHGNLRSWVHYLTLRNGNGTQKEHSYIAREITAIFQEEFPLLYDALLSEEKVD